MNVKMVSAWKQIYSAMGMMIVATFLTSLNVMLMNVTQALYAPKNVKTCLLAINVVVLMDLNLLTVDVSAKT